MHLYTHNFGAGPSELPTTVKKQLAEAIVSWDNTGISILSFPHRDEKFVQVIDEAKAWLYKLCDLKEEEYDIAFLQGGARQQFTQVPMNFLNENERAWYIDTGHWAHLSYLEATRYGNVNCLASSRESKYNHIPALAEIPKGLSYLHLTTNNTIFGTQWHEDLDTETPLIADMSSDMLGIKRDFSKYDMIYAGAQKNLGPAGVVIVIIKKSLKRASRDIPDIFSYDKIIQENSLYNTPNVFGIYAVLLTLRWIEAQGGLPAIHDLNFEKQKTVYDAIDSNPFFVGHSVKKDRSWMNLTFTISDETIQQNFDKKCLDAGIFGIKGHRSVGGYRASLYNAVSLQSARLLAEIIDSCR